VKNVDRFKVALHAARGLQYLHENNVIYRELQDKQHSWLMG